MEKEIKNIKNEANVSIRDKVTANSILKFTGKNVIEFKVIANTGQTYETVNILLTTYDNRKLKPVEIAKIVEYLHNWKPKKDKLIDLEYFIKYVSYFCYKFNLTFTYGDFLDIPTFIS